jgi:penicillin-binding protein A
MSRPLRRLYLFFALLFVALLAQLTYVQVFAAPKLQTNASNTRSIAAEMKVDRGSIVSADGVKLAVNRLENEYYVREYPEGSLTSPWLGYNSQRYGRAGVERVYNEELSGQSGLLGITSYWDELLNKTHEGADLTLTIDVSVQRAAAAALGERRGAVVALDPSTGAILAMVSYPRYDPNSLDEIWSELNKDTDTPLLNRAVQGRYPPGSVFKMVVAGAALEEGAVTPETEFTDTGSVTAGGFVVNNYGDNVYGEHDFAKAFASSINTTFAKVGVALGADTLARYAANFGFGTEFPWKMGGTPSFFPAAGEIDKAHLAQVSYGQGEVLSTPLSIALVASAMANDGQIMKPYLVARIAKRDGSVLEETDADVWLRPISRETAAIVRDLMVQVVKSGTGTAAALSGVQVAGKTGTAEVTDDEPHAWFAGFAPADNPKVVVAVLVENAGTGGSVAAPIAREVMAAALGL